MAPGSSFHYSCLFDDVNRRKTEANLRIQQWQAAMLAAQSPLQWFKVLTDYVNEVGEQMGQFTQQLSMLTNECILALHRQLLQKNNMALINTVFYYKTYPEQLYDEPLHPQKIISIKNRLAMLYQFIEYYQKNLFNLLSQRGMPATQDQLFHGEELPAGIFIEADEAYRLLIGEAVKEWRLVQFVVPDEASHTGRLLDVFRAYKFWFNPIRLIDAAMALKNSYLIASTSKQDDMMAFQRQLQIIYQQLSTTACLDLYGYFANKDSSYLMRSLNAVVNDQVVDGFPLLNHAEKQAVHRVHQSLECLMETLREELDSRMIATAPYDRHDAMVMKPGRRNLQALYHIVALYQDQPIEENPLLQRLFEQLE